MAIAKKKLNRKAMDAEIRNTLSGGLGGFEIFFMEHWKKLTVAGLILAAVIGLVYGMYGFMRNQSRKAMNALASAQTQEELVQALQKYGREPSAPFARIRLARMYLQNGKLTEAEAEYKKLETDGLTPKLLARVQLDRAYLLEKAGQLQKAADHFAVCGSNAAFSVNQRAEACTASGRLYAELKMKDAAKKQLDNCIRLQNQAGPDGQQWVAFAKFLLSDLK